MVSKLSEGGRRLLTWHDDGTFVKQPANGARADFRYEARILRMLESKTPSVDFPKFVHLKDDEIRMSAVDGTPVGPKFPSVLSADRIDQLVEVASGLKSYEPPRVRLRTYNPVARWAWRIGETSLGTRTAISELLAQWQPTMAFAHGDFIPRNMIDNAGTIALVDWEFAGWYPIGYDLATLWLVTGEVPGARERIESNVGQESSSFWFGAYVASVSYLGLALRSPPSAPFAESRRSDASRALDEVLVRAPHDTQAPNLHGGGFKGRSPS